jgi:hypothetical protein
LKKHLNLNWQLAAIITVLLGSTLVTTNSFAKGLYKSVNADGKITYSNHPTADSQTTKNVGLLKGSPKFSFSKTQVNQGSKKS